ncbi:hypothetical protein CROQUDRAFT_44474 [Cronartium quercuum f. sp. fusiforme G11]|uniref:CCAAT-binding factor domain-containing protein n=1 Tax=Cronartium quercuum f. sp. fusiforme G11 TaxID=708437 RepID=A0A9P6NLY2_9BASI|nr:hypothetical protein CROQUDRAFT_44474 [Cronartium quercuum f. sp. fusiforme G11]
MTAPKTLQTKTSTKLEKTKKVKNKSNIITIQQIRQYESDIQLSQFQDLNPISDLNNVLINFNSTNTFDLSTEIVHTTIYALHRIFSTLIRQGRIHDLPVLTSSEESVKVVTEWLKERYEEYVTSLLSLLRVPQGDHGQLALDGLTILMSLVRSESELSNSLRQQHASLTEKNLKLPIGGFDSASFKKLVKALLLNDDGSNNQEINPVRKEVKVEFILRYFNYCDDIRYHFLKDAAHICQAYHPNLINKSTKMTQSTDDLIKSSRQLAINLLHYLEALNSMPTESDELDQFWTGRPPITNLRKRKNKFNRKHSKKLKVINDGSTGIFDDSSSSSSEDEKKNEERKLNNSKQNPLLSLKSHQKVFSDCWISLLRLGLNESEMKRVLNILHDQVIPHMIDPKILMDFLTDCVDIGGTIAILALNGLFTLMSKHNLDYPAFYTRLYALLDRSVLHVRHRPRFFRMLNTFLSSTHLPVNIVASFLKRLSRLSLFAPPGAIITIIPFCYNLIKNHPSCMSMLHRQNASTLVNSTQENDPFDSEEIDPLKSGAVFSSLWELASLRSHYLASIATLSKVFIEAFDKPNYNLEDFLDHTYKTLFETEINRQIRKAPALSLFTNSFKFSSHEEVIEPNDIVSQIWRF